ncbi:MAG: hypothetical protein WCX31_19165 [Salinivirgaceae bacterium]
MIVISATELRTNQKKYFDLAEKERVMIKRGRKIIELVVSESVSTNPSPSGDPYYDDPENIAELKRRIEDLESGKSKIVATLNSKDEIKKFIERL